MSHTCPCDRRRQRHLPRRQAGEHARHARADLRRACRPPRFAWIGLYRPTDDELDAVAEEFQLHTLAVEDARKGHQRAKLERYDDTLFVVLRPARYLDATETVEFGEVHLFIGHDFAVTIRHAESPDLTRVRARLESAPELLAKGPPEAVLYAVLDEVVDEYGPVVAGLENDIDEIEEQLFSGDPAVTKRIYDLAGELMEFQRATRPIADIIAGLEAGFDKYGIDHDLQQYLRDVSDHTIRIVERGDEFRQVLQNSLTVHATLVAQRQNEEARRLTETSIAQSEQTKKISSWAAIIFAPSLIAAIYGMNFDHMPELHWEFGYPLAVAGMVVFAVASTSSSSRGSGCSRGPVVEVCGPGGRGARSAAGGRVARSAYPVVEEREARTRWSSSAKRVSRPGAHPAFRAGPHRDIRSTPPHRSTPPLTRRASPVSQCMRFVVVPPRVVRGGFIPGNLMHWGCGHEVNAG